MAGIYGTPINPLDEIGGGELSGYSPRMYARPPGLGWANRPEALAHLRSVYPTAALNAHDPGRGGIPTPMMEHQRFNKMNQSQMNPAQPTVSNDMDMSTLARLLQGLMGR